MASENFEVIIDTTNKCLMDCKYCGTNSSVNSKDYLSFDAIINVMSIVKSKFVNHVIYLGGGSFYCHPDFSKVLQFNVKAKSNIIIDLPLHEETFNFIKEYPPRLFNYTFSLSLWGIGDLHNKLSGRNTFGNISKLITISRELQQKVNISFVVSKELIAQKEELIDFLRNNINIDNVYFHRLMPCGRCRKEDLPKFMYIENFMKCLLSAELPCNIRFHHTICGNKCVAFKNRLFINYDGNIYGCGWVNSDTYSIGNVYIDKFEAICEFAKDKNLTTTKKCVMLS
ncbi:MAG: SPASM domain-containing protein [Clostridia bacterium]|nr:SPASM domain-containing protein [Clostridia bacterium]